MTNLKHDNSLLTRSLFKLTKNEHTFYKEGKDEIVVLLTDIKESFVPEFESVKSEVKQEYLKERAAKKMAELVQNLKKEAASGSLSAMKQGVVHQTNWLTKKEAEANADLRSKGINTEQIFQFENVGQAIGFEHAGNGYIVRLDGIKEYNETQFNEKKEPLARELDKELNHLVTAGFIASLYRNATIVKNETQLQLAS